MKKTIIAWTILILPFAVAGNGQKPPVSQPAPKAIPATADPDFVIGAEDMLEIGVWKEPDISRAVPVRPDGKISLPLLNDIQAAGLTPMQLQTNITEGLKKFITDPRVTVIVTQIN